MGSKNQFKKTRKQLSTSPDMLTAKAFKSTKRGGFGDHMNLQEENTQLKQQNQSLNGLLDARIQEHRKILENFALSTNNFKEKISELNNSVSNLEAEKVVLTQKIVVVTRELQRIRKNNKTLMKRLDASIWTRIKNWLANMFKS